ncbi:MAG: segregation/condensation protein A [Gammaproteobacteria bacterium]|nr:segregation/condensation protein A [Gammaproteobacteria bacterium]MDA7967924.1 segregation/condensation protein A [Gammaproteobacteria bacterium]MDA7969650.1 segregation/condensation protein A [Gammaproteobacteria bacterium]MDA7989838.1 segregation/condensation protein A [Gammaproteobacteria bacterium]MDA7995480.1 segregation/condensation protein A [Gammaproteobacteria bacterium]
MSGANDTGESGENGAAPARAATLRGERIEEWPQDLYIPPDALEVFLESFQGPLDLLLYLIRKQKMDILDIPVARITRQYMEYVELMRHLRLDLAAEYLVMAAWLAEIKSRMLLPRPADPEEEEEDPRAALVRRLQEYERYSKAAREINDRPRLERDLYLVAAKFDAPGAPEAAASLNDLLVAHQNVLDRSEQKKRWTVGFETLNVRDKMAHILRRMRTRGVLRFEQILLGGEGRLGLAVSFMAVLELARDRLIVVAQEKPFAPIHLKGADRAN